MHKKLNHYYSKPWDLYVQRVIIHTASYLDFHGNFSNGGRQRHIRDLAKVVRDVWKKDVLIVQKSIENFEKTCKYGFRVKGIKSNLTAYGDPLFAFKTKNMLSANEAIIYASGEDAWPFFAKNSKAIQHGIWWDGPQSFLLKKIQSYRVLTCMRSIKSMMCVDTNFINWLRGVNKSGFYFTKKCTYIPNYVDLNKLKVSSERNDAVIRILCARRYEEKRGINLFIEALSILKKYNFSFSAHISSDDSLGLIQKEIEKYNLDSYVTISADDLDQVLSRYSNSDIAVVPTIWSEGTSLACVEALCSGIPVIATPVGGLGNLIIPGFNGFLVNPDAESIASAILRMNLC